MITLGLVADVDADGIYVTLPGSRGVLRGPFETLQNVVAGDKVLVVTTDDGDCVVVGLAAASAPAVLVPDGSITSAKIADGTIVNADISGSAAIDRSKISGLPTSSTDNAVARFDGTGGALQNSGVTVDDVGNVAGVAGLNISKSAYAGLQVSSNAGTGPYIQLATAGVGRWDFFRNDETESGSNAGSNLQVNRLSDAGGLLGTPIKIDRSTGKITLGDVGSTAGLEFGSGGPRIMAGTGSPESVVTAPVGSLWLRTNGGAGTTLYVKESGTGNTGWVAK